MVRMTGFPPVAALADEQLSTVRSYGQIAVQYSPYFKSRLYNAKTPRQKSRCLHMVRMTGFPPVAALADEQLSTVRSCGQIAMQFSPYFKSRPYNAKTPRPKSRCLHMVRMTGFEPTRLSTLEPETSASAVPPHPHFYLSMIPYFLRFVKIFIQHLMDFMCFIMIHF